ncbi:unnamed protein product [marine sediment metagenome]|uniref:Uncharacterized protein n=1 Tax=marine sediment metagenome TaxID=412755 RepID=X1QNY4_9ZZZZ
MAKVISPGRPLATGVTHPRSTHSRVVSCRTKVVGAGVPSFGYTHSVGQNVWLLNVQLFIEPIDCAAGVYMLVRVLTGTNQPSDTAAILNWENVLPVLHEPDIDADIPVHFGRQHMSWDMNVLYKGVGRRFGIWTKAIVGMTGPFLASFEVSEG